MFSPRSTRPPRAGAEGAEEPLGLVASTRIAIEYQSLRYPDSLPRGVYVIPSEESMAAWDGILFIRDGPYDSSILRFSILFPHDFPKSAPKVRFETDVYHPMVAPKSKIWSTRGELSIWQPERHHIFHLLRALVLDFEEHALENITEEQAINKQLFILYKNSRQTFMSMTAQRARHSTSREVLYGGEIPEETAKSTLIPTNAVPSSPTRSDSSKPSMAPITPTKQRVRQSSGPGASPGEVKRREGFFKFSDLSEEQVKAVHLDLGRKLGISIPDP